MKIGSDFEKIEWNFQGFQLLEPNAFIGDMIISVLVIYLVFKLKRLKVKSTFNTYWLWFFIVFGLGFLTGGFGHLLYNYTGIPGKIPSYFTGILAVYFIEHAMFSIHPNPKQKKLFNKISVYKLVLVLILETLICLFVDLESNPTKGMALPTINSVIGMGFSLGYLGYQYYKKIHSSFRYLLISTFILLPSAIFLAFKINIHPWLDKNDVSHLLLIVSIILYYVCIKQYSDFVSRESGLAVSES
jgi:hypothetical protein|tara:strand:- start:5046 stop:5777 length:732 start_codon:yes stop_codon:yes gene_type:complete